MIKRLILSIVAVSLFFLVAFTYDRLPETEGTSYYTVNGVLAVVYYPNKKLTPGYVDKDVTQANLNETICKVGKSTSPKELSVEKEELIFDKVYDMPLEDIENYDFDNLIPLDLGGYSCVSNTWPMKQCDDDEGKTCFGYISKQKVEAELHQKVCASEMSLWMAQEIMKTDWFAYYAKMQHLKVEKIK
jgi:hypothetical protein